MPMLALILPLNEFMMHLLSFFTRICVFLDFLLGVILVCLLGPESLDPIPDLCMDDLTASLLPFHMEKNKMKRKILGS